MISIEVADEIIDDLIRSAMNPAHYIVVRDEKVVEYISALTADEAIAKQTEAGDLYVRVGPSN